MHLQERCARRGEDLHDLVESHRIVLQREVVENDVDTKGKGDGEDLCVAELLGLIDAGQAAN